MNKKGLLIVALLFATVSFGQYNISIKVIHADNKLALEAATVVMPALKKSNITDSSGITEFRNLEKGKYKVIISYAGFNEKTVSVAIPAPDTIIIVQLQPGEEKEEVIVQSTRTSRSIRNIPTRVEVIETEEIDEKSNMRPGNVSMLLHESTGIQVQQTSATSGNASIRIQGLDGRYTQLLKDGFANFGNFSSGLSVLEIPPLDLKQVEIIKGPASTLYGGGAIAGVVNFISKMPGTSAENNLLLNQSNIGQTNLGYFSSGRNKRIGYTLLAMVNNQRLYDADKDDFTELPRSFEFTLHPKIFFYKGDHTTFIIGNSFTKSDRKGGDVQVIRGKAANDHRYFEENNTIRNIATFEMQKRFNAEKHLTIKQSFSLFDRHINIPAYHFDGAGYNSFTDISYLVNRPAHAVVAGANVLYDYFNEKKSSAANRDTRNITAGTYIQDNWDIAEKIKLESGLRFDYVRYNNVLFSKNEFFALPRVSLLIKYSEKLSSRIGAGMGYKTPTMFTERTETIQYQDVQMVNKVRSEKSYGGTGDLNFRTRLGANLDFSFNQLFFYTWIDHPLVLENTGAGSMYFVNAGKPVQSKGFETNAKFIFKHDLKLFLGYTYTDAKAKYITGNQFLPLVPTHKFNTALIYEKHEFLKIGLEGYYTSPQYVYNGSRTPGFWEFGCMVEKPFKKFSLFLNFENFTDTRQSKFKPVANGPHTSPVFDDIWTHTEGFVVNGGIKIRI